MPIPSPEPQAELWMGAHPDGSSLVLPAREPLASLIEQEPDRVLGSAARAQYGARLPFLLKLLAAETPLSLQAHPSREQALAGYEREQTRGIAHDAPERNYKDRNHKPELLCALTPFAALCGFRSISETLDLFHTLDAPSLDSVVGVLEREPNERGLSCLFAQLLRASAETRATWAHETLARCLQLASVASPFSEEFAAAARIGSLYPGDAGIVSALLMNLLRLAPGEAIYLPAGNLHAYLHGVGIELMANSDNVLRGGLTPKHVAPEDLLEVLDFRAGPVEIVHGRELGNARIYETPASEFELQSFELTGSGSASVADRRGPEILFCDKGELVVRCDEEELSVRSGQSLFIAGVEPSYELRGKGRLFRACVGRA